MVRRFLHYDSVTGEPLGFYSNDVHDAIPEPHIEITGEDWQACLSAGGQLRYFADAERKNLSFEAMVSPPPTTDELWAALRAERNRRLAACDWTVLPDVPLSVEKIDEWKVYRQALRDLPENTTDPGNPVWPAPPA